MLTRRQNGVQRARPDGRRAMAKMTPERMGAARGPRGSYSAWLGGTATETLRFDVTFLPSGCIATNVSSWRPGGSRGGTITKCPEASAVALSWITPSRRSCTVTPGMLRPAITASPPGSIRTMSKEGWMSALSERSKLRVSAKPTVSRAGDGLATVPTTGRASRGTPRHNSNEIAAPANTATDVRMSRALDTLSIVDPQAMGHRLRPSCALSTPQHKLRFQKLRSVWWTSPARSASDSPRCRWLGPSKVFPCSRRRRAAGTSARRRATYVHQKKRGRSS